jgi:hypothetical protein
MDNRYENYGTNDRHRDKADSPVNRKAKMGKDNLPNHRADQTEQNISEKPVTAAPHQFASQPSCNQAGDYNSEHAVSWIRGITAGRFQCQRNVRKKSSDGLRY